MFWGLISYQSCDIFNALSWKREFCVDNFKSKEMFILLKITHVSFIFTSSLYLTSKSKNLFFLFHFMFSHRQVQHGILWPWQHAKWRKVTGPSSHMSSCSRSILIGRGCLYKCMERRYELLQSFHLDRARMSLQVYGEKVWVTPVVPSW